MNISKQELENYILVQKLSYIKIGKLYGVSDSYIRKYAKKLGIILPQKRKINSNEIFAHKQSGMKSKVYQFSDSSFKNIIKDNYSWKDIIIALGYKYDRGISSNVKKSIQKRCENLHIELNICKKDNVMLQTKGELFCNRKNWQSARSAITKNAEKVFFENNIKPKCAICGYENHVEVAHIKAVADFCDDTPIYEINALSNLIGLCPNHHWEYDNGLLKL